METGQCRVCGQDDIRVRKGGTLYTHQVGGIRCEGSGLEPAVFDQDVPDQGAPGPAPQDPAEDTRLAEAADGPLPETQPDREAAASAAAGEYRWRLTVKAPCPYLNDPAWHQANAQLAAKNAVRAGHTPTGEAVPTATVPGWDCVTITYTVPIG